MANLPGAATQGLFTAVLSGQPLQLADVAELVRIREPEGLFLKYKRGLWFDEQEDHAYEFRRYASGFANAEGGVLIVGVVGGEETQGTAQWTVEGVSACPSTAGWTPWLSHVLQDVAVRARVAWQTLKTRDGKDLVLVAVDRAQELIRLYRKPGLVCHLRIGDQTVPLDDTLYVLSPTSLHFGDRILNVAHDYDFEWALRARLDPLWPRAGGLVVQIAPGEFIIAGNGIMVTFASATPGVTAELECVDEARVAAGKFVATRRLNDDGPHQGGLTMGALAVQRVKVYSFK